MLCCFLRVSKGFPGFGGLARVFSRVSNVFSSLLAFFQQGDFVLWKANRSVVFYECVPLVNFFKGLPLRLYSSVRFFAKLVFEKRLVLGFHDESLVFRFDDFVLDHQSVSSWCLGALLRRRVTLPVSPLAAT